MKFEISSEALASSGNHLPVDFTITGAVLKSYNEHNYVAFVVNDSELTIARGRFRRSVVGRLIGADSTVEAQAKVLSTDSAIADKIDKAFAAGDAAEIEKALSALFDNKKLTTTRTRYVDESGVVRTLPSYIFK